MTLPSILLGFAISTMIGAFFHLWRGGAFKFLVLYIILSWVGFWAGHLIAASLNWHLGSLGPLRLLFAIIGNVLVLFLGYWLSLADDKSRMKKK